MPDWLTNRLANTLADRQQQGLFRTLTTQPPPVDFTSNDYLSLARSGTLATKISVTVDAQTGHGAAGSRLLAGNTAQAEALETYLAGFYHAETALLFNGGYMANVGLLACLPQPGDVLLTDELIHASLIDGARLSKATRLRFAHNSLADLAAKLSQTSPAHRVFVVVESLYSMDGDQAPLAEIAALCATHHAALIVDEAHASGVYGPGGAGLTVGGGLTGLVFARIHTFGKALGVHGAAVVGPAPLRTYLINHARSFIYATALPPHDLTAIWLAHEQLLAEPHRAERLHDLVAYFTQKSRLVAPGATWLPSTSPIQGVVVPGNAAVRRVALAAQQAGYDVRPIVSPTVAAGQERIRICLHAHNTEADIDGLLGTLATVM